MYVLGAATISARASSADRDAGRNQRRSADPPDRAPARRRRHAESVGDRAERSGFHAARRCRRRSAPFMTCPTSPPRRRRQAPTAVTRIAWQAADALHGRRDLTRTTDRRQPRQRHARPHCRRRDLRDRCAAAGRRASHPGDDRAHRPRPPQRRGIRGTPPAIQLYTLANAPLAWLPQPRRCDPSDGRCRKSCCSRPAPGETRDLGLVPPAARRRPVRPGLHHRPGALRAQSSGNSDDSSSSDYDGDAGDTIRFGDGVFGATADDGDQFTGDLPVRRRARPATSPPTRSRSSIRRRRRACSRSPIRCPPPAAPIPRPWSRCSASRRRRSARNSPAPCFRPTMQAAAETLPWVKRAGTAFRWTGSWLTIFTTPEPVASEQIDRRRAHRADRPAQPLPHGGLRIYVPDPSIVSIDL